MNAAFLPSGESDSGGRPPVARRGAGAGGVVGLMPAHADASVAQLVRVPFAGSTTIIGDVPSDCRTRYQNRSPGSQVGCTPVRETSGVVLKLRYFSARA